MNEVKGPRRYQVTFECDGEEASTSVGVFVKQTEGLHMAPATAGMHKVTFTSTLEQLRDVVTLIVDLKTIDNLIIRPHVPDRVPFARPPVDSRPLDTSHVTVKVIPPSHRAIKGSKIDPNNPYRRAVLEMLESRAIIHFTGVSDEFAARKLSSANTSNVLSRMIERGDIIRCGRGAYRKPTAEESADLIRRRQVMAGAPNPDVRSDH